MHRFFDDYMQVDDTGGPAGTGGLNYHDLALRVTDPVFKAFAGADLPIRVARAEHGRRRARPARLLHVAERRARFTISSRRTLSFATDADVASIYGSRPGTGRRRRRRSPTASARVSSRARSSSSAGVDTSPILKGVYLRRYVLCDTLGRPPAAAANAMLNLSPTQTTRQVTEQLTSVEPLQRLPHELDQPPRLRDRELRRARAHPHEANALPPRRHGRDQAARRYRGRPLRADGRRATEGRGMPPTS